MKEYPTLLNQSSTFILFYSKTNIMHSITIDESLKKLFNAPHYTQNHYFLKASSSKNCTIAQCPSQTHMKQSPPLPNHIHLIFLKNKILHLITISQYMQYQFHAKKIQNWDHTIIIFYEHGYYIIICALRNSIEIVANLRNLQRITNRNNGVD